MLFMESMLNCSLPEWSEKELEPNSTMEYITKINYKLSSGTPLLARLRYGFLIKEILTHFSQKINATLSPNRSLWLYSAHDLTISNILNSLGMFEVFIRKFIH